VPKKSDIVRYSAEQLQEMRRRGDDRTDWLRVDATTEEELEASIAADPDDVHEPIDWNKTVSGVPPIGGQVDVPIDTDVIAWFRGAGGEYRTRINNVLRAYIKRRKAITRRQQLGS
jgi:uncharacterized protein (DUF4415 family)